MRKSFTYEGQRYWISGADEIECAVHIALKTKALEDGDVTLNSDTTVKKYSEIWKTSYIKESVGEATYASYVSNLNLYVLPDLGKMKMKDVKRVHIQNVLNKMTGHSKSHVLKVRQLMYRMFKDAKIDDVIKKNPAEDLKLPVCSDGGGRSITDKEREYILRVAEWHKAGLWVKLMLYTGLRPGETAALQWSNIDLKRKVLRVEHARKAKTSEIGAPKSSAGKRKVPIPNHFIEELTAASKGKSKFDYVFVQETTGNRHSLRSMNQLWHSFKRDLNIAMGCRVERNQLMKPYPVAEDLIPYCLRHTYCTDLQAARVPINVAKEFMGHSSIETTANIYTDFSEDAFDYSADLINSYAEKKKRTKRAHKRAGFRKAVGI